MVTPKRMTTTYKLIHTRPPAWVRPPPYSGIPTPSLTGTNFHARAMQPACPVIFILMHMHCYLLAPAYG
ncbi:MAG: hypothetical protein KF860_03295 [Cyclobacteriaceae bacterium]|nr:hypothetical protein [Cyclobacteriaceae bacterium]